MRLEVEVQEDLLGAEFTCHLGCCIADYCRCHCDSTVTGSAELNCFGVA